MPYSITLSDGVTTLITVPDRMIVGPLALNAPSNCSLNLVGRGARHYGLAEASNAVWLLQNFASAVPPPQPLAGQLWYDTTIGDAKLQLYNTAQQWVPVQTATPSDYRLKRLFGPADVGAAIDAVPVYNGAFKAHPEQKRPMILAHELQTVFPWAVHGAKDAIDANGNPILQQVDHAALLPAVLAELRALRARVAALEAAAA